MALQGVRLKPNISVQVVIVIVIFSVLNIYMSGILPANFVDCRCVSGG